MSTPYNATGRIGAFLRRPSAAVIPLPAPNALQVVRRAIGERAKHLRATEDQRHSAFKAALREVDAGRSAAVAIAVGYGVLTGRTNALLHTQQVPA